MALFAVPRYLGDDEETNTKKLDSSTILEKLQAKAKARRSVEKNESLKHDFKKEKSSSSIEVVDDIKSEGIDDSSDSKSTHKKHKKHKKHKSKDKDDEVKAEIDIIEDETCVTESKSKKKKKLRKDSLDEENEITKDEALCDSSKKKKRKLDKEKSEVVEDMDTSNNVIEKVQKDKSVKKLKGKKDKSISEETVKTNADEEDEHKEDLENADDLDADAEEKKETKKDGKDEVGGFTVIGNVKPNKLEKVNRVLPDWLSSPSVIKADVRLNKLPVTQMSGLDPEFVEKLAENDITHFFPVQLQVIPALLESSLTGFLSGRAGYRPSDICVSAPTGSGKTLAFVIPICQALKARVTCEIRALVVLPVQDLAAQVYKVFQTYCKGTQLKVGLMTSQKTFAAEQQLLVRSRLYGYQNVYDIIVTTPGRLVDHINKTEGFNLQHLRYLVIDEADRMMDEIKHDWLLQVESAVYKGSRTLPGHLTAASCQTAIQPLQKLLYSATLSQNPEKLQQLNLFQPKLFTSVVKVNKDSKGSHSKKQEVDDASLEIDKNIAEGKENVIDDKTGAKSKDLDNIKKTEEEFVGKYSTPSSLSEFYIETSADQKPLVLLHLLHHLKYKQILCFTNSVIQTHRLFLLVKMMGDISVKEFSSNLPISRRSQILRKFQDGSIDIIICSDTMARGIDIPDVKYVISYDPPPYIQTYIHRIGRTARAGKDGTAITFIQKKEFFHFKKMVREAGKVSVRAMAVHKTQLKPLVTRFQDTLKKLPNTLKAEKTDPKQRKKNA